MIQYHSITFHPVQNDDVAPITLSAPLDENDMIAGDWFVFGFYHQHLRDGDIYPLLLKKDGTIDFGANTPDRFWSCNCRERPMVVGNMVTFIDDSRHEYTYSVREVFRYPNQH